MLRGPLLEGQGVPLLSGYVTNVGTGSVFEVNGTSVFCTGSTRTTTSGDPRSSKEGQCPARFLGESVRVFGNHDFERGGVAATEIDADPVRAHSVEGSAVIDSVLATTQAGISAIVSADGYRIEIPASVHPVFDPPLKAVAEVKTNMWMRYSGLQHEDGTVTATAVTLAENVLKEGERKADQKVEFDPALVKPGDKQSRLNVALHGKDAKHYPPTQDLALQARVDDLGRGLVPTYQRDLPNTDPSKIPFRFQVVQNLKLRDAVALPNGIVLIPEMVATQLKSDAQLATVLADAIAEVIEKQTLRTIPVGRALIAQELAADAGSVVVPGLSLGSLATEATVIAKLKKKHEEQSGRVSLTLLHQAGFDLAEAPKAWWTLSNTHGRALGETAMPDRAKYLYQVLGACWRERLTSTAR